MDKIEVNVQTLNTVLGYLGKRPYEEVFHLITMIQEEAKNQLPKPEAAQEPEVQPQE